jgi:predicted DNA binding CopG/RHH family protein
MSSEYATLGVSEEVRDRAREEADRRGVTYDRLLRDLLDDAENDH